MSAPNQEEDIKKAEKAIELFLEDLKSTDPKWEKCSQDETVTFWKSQGTGDQNGIYKIKFVGRVPFSMDIVCKVLFDYELRRTWDKVIDRITEIDTYTNGSKVIHIASRSPFPLAVAHRDFVHLRTDKYLDEKNEKRVILDISTTHSKAPPKDGYVRAYTYVSGGLFESAPQPNVQTKKLEDGTLYSMITQVDFKGYIPVWVVNMIAARTTLDWFYTLKKACEEYTKGQVKVSP